MFLEFSLKKMVPILVLLGSFGLAVYAFVFTENKTSFIEKTVAWMDRQQGDLTYKLSYGSLVQTASTVFYRNSAFAAENAQAIPVLLYHGTPPEGNSNPPLPQNVFVEQMKTLKDNGWQTISMDQFKAFMKDGTPLPAKSFLLTFDDGRKESFYPVDPVLKDLGFRATMFVITGFSLKTGGKPSTFYLTKTELAYMAASGRWDLESHGAEDHLLYDVPAATTTSGTLPTIHQEHFLSNKFWLPDVSKVETTDQFIARVTGDLTTAKNILQQDFGKPVIAYAYPFNDYGQDTVNFPDAQNVVSNIVPSLYDFAFYQVDPTRDDPYNYPDQTNYMVKRIEPVASWSGQDLLNLLEQTGPKTLPYQKADFGFDWNGNWGSVQRTSGTLALRATTNSTGAAALLNGSEEWQDYSVNATVDWKGGSNVSLIGRYQSDSKTFLSCAFSGTHIVVEGHENGVQTTLANVPYIFLGPKNKAQLSLSLKGSHVACSASGVVAQTDVKSAFTHPGNVGIQVWDQTPDIAGADLTAVSIRAL